MVGCHRLRPRKNLTSCPGLVDHYRRPPLLQAMSAGWLLVATRQQVEEQQALGGGLFHRQEVLEACSGGFPELPSTPR